jgi:hypothetical protein
MNATPWHMLRRVGPCTRTLPCLASIIASMPIPKDALLEILRDTRALLALPNNDFAWSTWENPSDALSELDGFISHIQAGRGIDGPKLSILFAPTGNIQEVSMNSGWGEAFLRIAERFDSAFSQYGEAGRI